MNLESFVAKQLELLELERDAEIEENRCLLECGSLKDLQKKGVCIPKLHLASSHTGLFGRFINNFEPFWPGKPLPCHNIRSGDIVGIGQLASDGKCKIISSGVVTRIKEESISIALEKSSEEFSVLESDMQCLIIKLANDVTYKRLKKGLKYLNQDRNKRNGRLVDVLFGNSKPTCGMSINSTTFFNKNLNKTQCDAVEFALAQKEVSLLHGPPGTGKTTTVVEIVMQSVARKLKVLACAPSNVAVDNLVEKLSSYKVKMIRLGHPARFLPSIHNYSLDAVISEYDGSRVTDDLRKEINTVKAEMEKTKEGTVKRKLWAENKLNLKELKVREKAIISEILKKADVVLCTLTSAAPDGPIKYLPQGHFDIVVIDECSQALEASCWISLIHVPRCVLAGDHHQLPPTIISDKASKEGLAETLMERLIKLHGNSIVKVLNIQYRMHQKIMEWPSKQLYDGKLEAHASVISHLLKDIVGVEDNENTSVPLLLIDTTGCDLDELDAEDEISKGNEGEADLVSHHVENLVKSGVEASDIAVITPYNLQVDLIKSRLSSKYPHLEIKSVDGFQGREKEAVILSLVRSNAKGEVGFLAENRRINVAITRAKRHLAVICNSETVSHHPFLKSFVHYMSTEGEIRSASLYEAEIGHYLKFSPKIVELHKPTVSGNDFKKREKPSIFQEERIGHKQNIIPQVLSGKADELDGCLNCILEKESSYRAEKLEEFRTILKHFVENSEEYVLKFSPHLNAFERRIVHEVSEGFELLHISQGKGAERYIEVKKVEKSRNVKSGHIDKFCDEAERCLDSVCNTDKESQASYHNILSNASFCMACGMSVPANDTELHMTHCTKVNMIKDKKSRSCKTKVKAMAHKNKSSNTNVLSDAEFDAIIKETIKSNNTCTQNKCKKNVTTLGQECQFCQSRFCYSHFIPEIHGCGDAAKAHGHRQLRKDGTVYSGSGKPQRNSDTVKHVQLQHKLNKRLADLSNQRKAKQKN